MASTGRVAESSTDNNYRYHEGKTDHSTALGITTRSGRVLGGVGTHSNAGGEHSRGIHVDVSARHQQHDIGDKPQEDLAIEGVTPPAVPRVVSMDSMSDDSTMQQSPYIQPNATSTHWQQIFDQEDIDS